MHPNKSLSLSLLSPTAPALQVGEPEGSLPLMARFSSPWSQALLQAPCTGDKQPQTVSCCCLCTGTTCVWCVHCWEHWGETGGGFFCNMLTLSSGHGSLHMEQHAIPEKHPLKSPNTATLPNTPCPILIGLSQVCTFRIPRDSWSLTMHNNMYIPGNVSW